jgi:hypothetical protein
MKTEDVRYAVCRDSTVEALQAHAREAGREEMRKRAIKLYRNENYRERNCDNCGKPYRGPAVYCSLECALAAV